MHLLYPCEFSSLSVGSQDLSRFPLAWSQSGTHQMGQHGALEKRHIKIISVLRLIFTLFFILNLKLETFFFKVKN